MDNHWTKEQIEALAQAGCKFTPGGSHISRTVMLVELKQVLDAVPSGSPPDTYRSAILALNVLGKGTESTRQKSLRHLRELYALDEATPIFGLLRKLHAVDAESLPKDLAPPLTDNYLERGDVISMLGILSVGTALNGARGFR